MFEDLKEKFKEKFETLLRILNFVLFYDFKRKTQEKVGSISFLISVNFVNLKKESQKILTFINLKRGFYKEVKNLKTL